MHFTTYSVPQTTNVIVIREARNENTCQQLLYTPQVSCSGKQQFSEIP